MAKIEQTLWVLEHVVYLFLLFLGVFFIYQGDVIDKYQTRRTNFAGFEEHPSELPTILTYVEYTKPLMRLKYEIDFNMSYEHLGSPPTNLSEGTNLISGTDLEVHFQIQREYTEDLKLSAVKRQVKQKNQIVDKSTLAFQLEEVF